MTSKMTYVKALFDDKAALEVLEGTARGISETEWSALTAGTAGYEASLFTGQPDWDGLMNTPDPELTEEEQSFLDNEVEELCAMVNDWKVRDELHDLPPEVWQFIKEKGFFGLIIPKKYGGKEFSAYAHSCIVAKLGSRSGTAAVSVMVPNSLGPAELLLQYGTEEQKDYFLPRLAQGLETPCFALTSEKAGSDATSLVDEGVVFKDKETGELKIRLNWKKRYTTLAPVSTILGVAYRLKDPEGLLGDQKDLGITLSLVPSDTPGVNRNFRHRPGGSPFQNGPHWGTDVEVPLDTIIGGQKQAGNGWNMLVDCLSIGRAISLPASSNGSAKYLARVTGAYARIRKQFEMPIANMEAIQEYLTRIAGYTYMIDSATVLPLQDLDIAHKTGDKARPAVSSAILKYNTTLTSASIINDSMAVHAGKAVVEGPNNPVAHLYQTAPVGLTVEGATSLTRALMTFGQGSFLAHPYTLKEIQAAKADDAKKAGKTLRGHVGYMVGNYFRSMGRGITNGAMTPAPHDGADKPYYQQTNRLTTAFTAVANVIMVTFQSKLKGKQRISALMADTLSNLYMASQVLRRWNYEGRLEEDRPLMEWSCQTLLYNAEQNLGEVIDNMPGAALRTALRASAFPLGQRLKKPSHRLANKVADIITEPGEARDRLTKGMYIPDQADDYVARLESAFLLAHKAEPYEAAITHGLKKGKIEPTADTKSLVSQAIEHGFMEKDTNVDEVAQLLEETEKARNDIIAVDCFPLDWVGEPLNPEGPIVPK